MADSGEVAAWGTAQDNSILASACARAPFLASLSLVVFLAGIIVIRAGVCIVRGFSLESISS